MDAASDFLHARYEVRRADGSEFGPVSAWTLAEWRESRRVFDTDGARAFMPAHPGDGRGIHEWLH